MSNVTQDLLALKLAWLAGLVDGEGSIGIGFSVGSNGSGRKTFKPQIQLVMTHDETVREAVRILRLVGVDTLVFSRFAERESRYKDVSRFGITRFDLCRLTANTLLPYAVTKKQHLEVFLTFLNSRFARCGTISGGRIKRGGDRNKHWVDYNEAEIAAYTELKRLNTRCKPEDEQTIVTVTPKIINDNAYIQCELDI